MIDLLFPQLRNARWRCLNLNKESLAFQSEHNPLLDPLFCQRWVEGLHLRYHGDYSYGGYLEDRSHLWRGHYHQPGHFWHLGEDYNVPFHTEVHLPADAVLIHAGYDTDYNGGWGGKLVFIRNGLFLIIAHLEEIANKVGAAYKKGDVIGKIARFPMNGNWYPHVHVQCMRTLDLEVDGYSALYAEIRDDFPPPSTFFLP